MKNTKYNQLSRVDATALLKVGEHFIDKLFTTSEVKETYQIDKGNNLRRSLNTLEDYKLIRLIPSYDLFEKKHHNTKTYVITPEGILAFNALSKIQKCSNMISIQDRFIDLLIILNSNNEEKLIIKDILNNFCDNRELENKQHNSYYDLIRVLRKQQLVTTSPAHKRKNGINIIISDLGKVFLNSCLELDKLLGKENVCPRNTTLS